MSCSCCNSEVRNCIELVPIFAHLTKEETHEIALITEDKYYDKGEHIYTALDTVNKLYVIHKGRVKIYRLSPSGKEQVIRILGPGDFIGELSLFSPRPATDYALVTDKAVMCVIDGKKFTKLISNLPTISFKILEELSHRLEKVEDLVEDINLHTVEERLIKSILEISKGKDIINLNMSKGDFASQLGMTQETLSRKLAAFQDEGLLDLDGHRKIIIRDRQRLENILEI